MPTRNALQPVLTAVGMALAPFRFVANPAQAVTFFRQLGYEIPPGAFGSALTTFSAKCGGLMNSIGPLAISTDDAGTTLSLGKAVEAITDAISALGQLRDQIKLAVPGLPAID